MTGPRVAIVHDWLTIYGGAERVLEQMLICFPNADIFTVIDFLPKASRGFLGSRKITTSFLQKLPLVEKKYWNYCFLIPFAVEQFDLSGYDIVLSSSHIAAKGALVGPDQLHVCYCHSPVRFAWDLQSYYLSAFGYESGVKSALARLMFHYLRLWDVRTANGVDAYIANSHFIERRIAKAYRREAAVIYPPVDVDRFELHREKHPFYLTASFMNPFKKLDLIVQAFNRIPERQLVVIGNGPDLAGLKRQAGANIQFLGYQPVSQLKQYMQKARAFLFAAPEDFGIIMAEAQACGTPVIAYDKGGAAEIVRRPGSDQTTGVLFPQQTVASLIEAVEAFEALGTISPEACRANSLRFSPELFREALQVFVEKQWQQFDGQRRHSESGWTTEAGRRSE